MMATKRLFELYFECSITLQHRKHNV